jgi:diguanylate cyclase (GGDEF)-like protein
MDLDVNTLFMVTMHVEIMLGLLLFFAWAQNFSKSALAWWGSAHLLRAASIMLFGMYGTLPDWASIDLANAALFTSFAVTWSGARVFDRRSAEPVWCLVGVAIWLLVCRLPQFANAIEVRALVGSGIVTTYTWLAAYEFWRGRDEALVSRWPAIFMLFAHGSLFLLRTPLGVMMQLSPTNDFSMSAWLELLSLEALLFTISIAFILLAMAKERTEYRHRTAALTDALTGIANRRGFLEQSASSKRWMMDTRPTAVMLFDVDRFKLVNDHSGHAVGDQVLLTFANTAKAHVGAAGLVGRWGGDEFAAVIYDTSREAAVALAEQIRGAFERAVNDLDACQVQATVSTGIVFSAAGPLDLPALLVQADQALYRAKEQGRNRIAVAASDPQWDRDGDGRVVPIESRRRKTASAA